MSSMADTINPHSANSGLDTSTDTAIEAPYHDYGIHFTSDGKRRDVLICDSNPAKTPLYLAEMRRSGISKKQPDVRLCSIRSNVTITSSATHDGTKLTSKEAKYGDVVAVAYFPAFSTKIHMGFGDPDIPEKVQWETLRMPSIGVYEFPMPSSHDKISNQNATTEQLGEAGMTYSWRHTHKTVDEADGTTEARQKLLNSKGEIVALFIPNRWRGWSMTGTLRVFEELSVQKLENMTSAGWNMMIRIIVTRCAIAEKMRR